MTNHLDAAQFLTLLAFACGSAALAGFLAVMTGRALGRAMLTAFLLVLVVGYLAMNGGTG